MIEVKSNSSNLIRIVGWFLLVGLIIVNFIIIGVFIKPRNDNHTNHNKSMNFEDLEGLASEEDKIPRIVHLSWKDENIPLGTVKWVKQWTKTNPEYQIWFWTDKTVEKFINRNFPEQGKILGRYKAAIYRNDAVRYMILYEYGGIWADLDVEPLKSMEPIRDKYPAILSQESELHARYSWGMPILVCNAFMATRKRHPYFKFLVDMLEVNQKQDSLLPSTGPVMVTRMHKAYDDFYQQMGTKTPWNRVHVASIDTFMPKTDVIALDALRSRCVDGSIDTKSEDLCAKYLHPDFRNEAKSDSFTNHHWWHSYLGDKNFRTLVPISSVVNNVIFPGGE